VKTWTDARRDIRSLRIFSYFPSSQAVRKSDRMSAREATRSPHATTFMLWLTGQIFVYATSQVTSTKRRMLAPWDSTVAPKDKETICLSSRS
jgi:hypothetical protein